MTATHAHVAAVANRMSDPFEVSTKPIGHYESKRQRKSQALQLIRIGGQR
jgi:hypothetical protein